MNLQHTDRNSDDWNRILQALVSDVEAERIEAETELLRSGAGALRDLILSLRDESTPSMWAAGPAESRAIALVRLLARSGDPGAFDALCELVRTPPPFCEYA